MYNSIYPVLAAQTHLPFYLSGAGISDPEYHVVRPEGLVSCQILFTKSGSGVLRVDGRELPQTPGSLFFLTTGVPHEYFPESSEWQTAWVVFRGAHLRELLTEMGFGAWHERSAADLSACEQIFSRILSAAADPLSGGERCSVLVYEYLLEVRSQLFSGARSDVSLTDPAVRFMDENFSRDITLEELAGLCGVSMQHFCRVFRQKCGMRPMEYLALRRVAEAKRLLSSTDVPVTEIAAMVGYSTPTYFGTVFRRYEGVSPSVWRTLSPRL